MRKDPVILAHYKITNAMKSEINILLQKKIGID